MSEEEEKLVKVYSGTELSVNLLKDELAKAGIFSIIQNDFQSGIIIIAGFSGGGYTAVDLFRAR